MNNRMLSKRRSRVLLRFANTNLQDDEEVTEWNRYFDKKEAVPDRVVSDPPPQRKGRGKGKAWDEKETGRLIEMIHEGRRIIDITPFFARTIKSIIAKRAALYRAGCIQGGTEER